MKTYDNYEIHPCRRYEEPDSPGKFYFEVCEPNVADVWTLYGHFTGEGVEAIGDFATCEYAEETFSRITGIPSGSARDVAARLRVMHAGPRLLEALECLLDALGGLPISILDGPAYHALHKAQTAIAKATAAC
jgi:hypothetical protein